MYKKILVPLDGSKLAECVFPHLETLLSGSDAPEVILAQAVEPYSIPYGREIGQLKSMAEVKTFETHQKTDAEKYLREIVERLDGTAASIPSTRSRPTSAPRPAGAGSSSLFAPRP